MLVTSYVNGSSAGSAGHNPAPTKRGEIKGWTQAQVRRHTQWLYGVDAPALSGTGVAVTLTVRDCPASADDWMRARERFFVSMRRAGMIRGHWVTEWQRRRVPHMHGAIYFPEGTDVLVVIGLVYMYWLAAASEFSPGSQSQDVKAIDGAEGWLQYLSKHAARGVRHYQRWGHPEGWEKTGRLWGKLGEWPVIEPLKFDMSSQAYWRYRRLMRGWREADARAALGAARTPEARRTALRRIRTARGMLKCSDGRLSPVRGVSEWAGQDVSLAFVSLLADDGHLVLQREA